MLAPGLSNCQRLLRSSVINKIIIECINAFRLACQPSKKFKATVHREALASLKADYPDMPAFGVSKSMVLVAVT